MIVKDLDLARSIADHVDGARVFLAEEVVPEHWGLDDNGLPTLIAETTVTHYQRKYEIKYIQGGYKIVCTDPELMGRIKEYLSAQVGK